MNIKINGEETKLPCDKPTVADALQWHLSALERKQSFAVAVNSSFIAKDNYTTTPLASNDCVDIFLPIQGG
ncbi:sulfur carrier protein ThiS [Thalassotalea sp. M1531]|uniref:Sulfur carrier protein ThiS n=1 Tax=Thalassotalea algicola TaxID=2716224 RepID=A0A7Y0LAQ4_9GAMM|nr:sulfur carrier protein ThiS [Thalassotalea algicola]NMP30642.1 sulfur carrier protein ThiS [Thalassotalea algicola]